MSNNNLEVHFVDFNAYYMTYGIITMMITILLLWYFIKSSFGLDYEGMNAKYVNLVEGDKPELVIDDSLSGADQLQAALVKKVPYEWADEKTGYDGFLQKGEYGGVPVYLMTPYDDKRSAKWRPYRRGLAVMNSRTWWQDVDRNILSDAWDEQAMIAEKNNRAKFEGLSERHSR